MRIFLFLFSLFGFALVASAATENPVMCTMEYAPVCGTVQVQCITTPCNGVRETFGNACMAGVAKATNVTMGECEPALVIGGGTDSHGCLTSAGYSWNASKNACTRSWEDTQTGILVGGDSDEHGCKASAGYSWDATLAQCIRVWEKPQTLVTWAHNNALTRYADVSAFGYERSLTRQEAAAIIARAGEKVWGLRYASYPDDCNVAYSDESTFDITLKNDIYSACALDLMRGQSGRFSPTRTLSRAETLAIVMRGVDGGKKDESGAMWYENYADRAHELGILSFANFKGFDEAITRGELIEWIYSASKYVESQNSASGLSGTWNLYEFNATKVTDTARYTLNFDGKSVAAKFCNNVFGSYSVNNMGVFTAPNLASTEMYCEGLPMTLEGAFALDGASYAIMIIDRKTPSTEPNTYLVITTKKGDIFRYAR